MRRSIFKVIGVIILGVLIIGLSIRYSRSIAVKRFLETDYQIVYTFEELPEIAQKEILRDIHNYIVIQYDMTTDALIKEGKLSEEELEKRLQYRSKLAQVLSKIANPTEIANLSDVITGDYPNRQMKYSGISNDSCFIYYVFGGFAPQDILAVYSLKNNSSKCSFRITNPGRIETIPIEKLKENVAQGIGDISFDDKL